MTDKNTAKAVNVIGKFCGLRDVDQLARSALLEKYGFEQADVFVLFGGSILAGGDILAQAIKDNISKTYVIVGGAGHTTETFRQRVHSEYPEIETAGLSEAEIFQRYLQQVYGCKADYLETQSTNCGNNITNLLDLLCEKNIMWKSIILCQDASMQNRMDAGLRKYAPADTIIINYASYRAHVTWNGEKLEYTESIHGMWDMERYVNLLMGEIPRLTDDCNGYGPAGKGYIAHVDVPDDVRLAFEDLQADFGYLSGKQIPCLHLAVEFQIITVLTPTGRGYNFDSNNSSL